ncbi:MAG TPA: helicase C-terminal domain-containing protein [Candidatus Nanoarchaeia archaeon]|nr:helicase C-terminal domain-containing protein [Candidatus Nanoarchaeia archaeon]
MTTIALPSEVASFFPYESVRPYQDEFISVVYNAVKERRSVLVEGSNGLGKTISALSAVLPTAIEKKMKILYVARTHRQHERVIEELKAISKKYSGVAGVSLRGRNEMCLYKFDQRQHYDAKSLMEVCDMLKAKGTCPYYKSADQQSYDYLSLQQQIGTRSYKASEIMRICRRKNICPYELVKSALSDVNVIALSYLYVFDPDIRTAFLKNLETQLAKIILIVDEAHNLPETAVDISSSNLSLFVIRQAEQEAKRFGYEDVEAFAKLLYQETEKKAATVNKEEIIDPAFLQSVQDKAGILAPRSFYLHLGEIGNQVKKTLLSEGKHPRSYINSMSEFLLKWTETVGDEAYINVISRYFTREKAQTAKLEIVALDPAKTTQPVFDATYANVVMSGTLQPLDAYARITRLPENTVQHIAPSPFPREHICSLVCLGVTTALESRTSAMYQTYIKRIQEVVRNTPVNTGIFTASFDVSRSLIAEGLEDALERPLFQEQSGMTSKTNEKLVAEFKEHALTGGAVFLGVQGGRTSEGVDFPGNQMNSVIIIGLPYATPTPRVKAQIDYYEKKFPTLGREYGYVLPAMKKASQCAGRPVRTLEDRGAIVFMDYRFAGGYCKRFLPNWVLRDLKILPAIDGILSKEIREFFTR